MKKEHLSRRRFLCSAAALAGGLSLFGPSAVLASPAMTCAESQGLPPFIDPRGWSGEAWKAALPVFRNILVHPFVTELAAATTPAVRSRMTEAYVTATRMEWMFWDSAWKKEGWPV